MQVALAMAGWQPERLRAAAAEESGRVLAAMGESLPPGLMLKMPVGEVPISRAAQIRWTEYVVHGHDLEPALGRSRPVPGWFIDAGLPMTMHLITMMHSRSPRRGQAASFHFHRTDGEGEWTLRAEAGQASSEEAHHRADVAFRGPGMGLYWMVMGRGGPAAHQVEVVGDSALAAAFKEWFPGP
jgi:hypothetical protein